VIVLLSAIVATLGTAADTAGDDTLWDKAAQDVVGELIAAAVSVVGMTVAFPVRYRRQRVQRGREAKRKLEAWLIDVRRYEDELQRVTEALLKGPRTKPELPAPPGFPSDQLTLTIKAVDYQVGEYALELDRKLGDLRWWLSQSDPQADRLIECVSELGRAKGHLLLALHPPRHGETFDPHQRSR
jgi:hypothetical protein